MDEEYVVRFVISDFVSKLSATVFYAGLSDGLDMTAKPSVALKLDLSGARRIAEWLNEQSLEGMRQVEIVNFNSL